MITFFTDHENGYLVSSKKGTFEISEEMYDCLMNQYRIMGWKEESFKNITNFFPNKG